MHQYRASNISAGSQWRASWLRWTRLSRFFGDKCSKCESNQQQLRIRGKAAENGGLLTQISQLVSGAHFWALNSLNSIKTGLESLHPLIITSAIPLKSSHR
jgi:hypothetical protein